MAHEVFISYSSHDKTIADAVCARLEGAGIRCWIAPRDIMPGAEWSAAIVEAIQSSRVMVLIFSSNSDMSKQVHREVQTAFDGEVSVVPFRIEEVHPGQALQYYLGPVHWLDALTEPLEQHLDRLRETVAGILASVPSPASESSPRPEPPPPVSQEKQPVVSEDKTVPPPPSIPIPQQAGVAETVRPAQERPGSRMLLGIGLVALILLAAVIWGIRQASLHETRQRPFLKGKMASQEARGTEDSSAGLLLQGVEDDSLNVVQQSLDHGADVNIRDAQGNTPLILAAEAGHVPMMQLLLKRGADVNARNHEDRVALGRAAYEGRIEAVRLLLKWKADCNIPDKYHETILHAVERAKSGDHLATEKQRHTEILTMLRAAGATE